MDPSELRTVVQEIVREELGIFGDAIAEGMRDPILEAISKLQHARPGTGEKKAQKKRSDFYHAVLAYLQAHRGEYLRPGDIAKSGLGVGPQPVGMVLRGMESEGIVQVRDLPPNEAGWVAREYCLPAEE